MLRRRRALPVLLMAAAVAIAMVPVVPATAADGSGAITLEGGSDQIRGFAIGPDGSLTPLGTVATPATAVGMVGK